MITFAIIGCGNIGQKRAKALAALSDQATLIACVDLNSENARKCASHFPGCETYDHYESMLKQKNPDAVIIATTHDALSVIGEIMICAGKHLLLEKPAGRNADEIKKLISAAENKKIIIRVGFNHRYHPAIMQAKKMIDQGDIGDLMYIRARYGHGGRLGYEKEWRANPALSGGGELIDQGIHLIDLSRWILGEFSDVKSALHTYYWNMPVEDNAFLILQTKNKKTAFLHASCTEWKNIFSFEIFGITGKLQIEGLGGSYGKETLTHYKMLPKMGPPEIKSHEYPNEDLSWQLELAEFISNIKNFKKSSPNLHDAEQALLVVKKIYEQSQ